MTLKEYFMSDVRLQREWASEKNAISPEKLTIHFLKKVWWRCEKGHEWQAAPHTRVYSKSNCPYCSGKKAIPGKTDLATTHPHVLPFWSERNTLSPSEVMAGSHQKAIWVCKKGHEWEALINNVVKAGTGCPYCSGRKAIPGETDLATTHPHVLPFWSERNTLSPTEVMAGSNQKAVWVCEKGHEWEATVQSVAKAGTGCPVCAGTAKKKRRNDSGL